MNQFELDDDQRRARVRFHIDGEPFESNALPPDRAEALRDTIAGAVIKRELPGGQEVERPLDEEARTEPVRGGDD